MAEINCRHFSGYKPCPKNAECDRAKCEHYAGVDLRILLIHLEAMGAVLRSTSHLAAIRRQYPRALITWVTKAPAHHLLRHVPGVDRVLTTSPEDLLVLAALEFDLALVIDKSLAAVGVLNQTSAAEVRGFRADPVAGAIVPANPEAVELWQIGLNDHKKFFTNTKTEQQLVHESLKLGPYESDEYALVLTAAENAVARQRKKAWSPAGRPVIGINTGCAATLPAKKLTVEGHRQLIAALKQDDRFHGSPVVLLGGPDETERNQTIVRDLGGVIASPTDRGLRDGLISVAACDVVFSGDSLGMHMAIALRKWVVAWFGPTCAQEIELYGRGVKIRADASCSPCWKRSCQQPMMCYDLVDFSQVLDALAAGVDQLSESAIELGPRRPRERGPRGAGIDA